MLHITSATFKNLLQHLFWIDYYIIQRLFTYYWDITLWGAVFWNDIYPHTPAYTPTHHHHTWLLLRFRRLWYWFSKSSLCQSKNSPKDMVRQEAGGKALVSLGKSQLAFLYSTKAKLLEGEHRSQSKGHP